MLNLSSVYARNVSSQPRASMNYLTLLNIVIWNRSCFTAQCFVTMVVAQFGVLLLEMSAADFYELTVADIVLHHSYVVGSN